MSNLWIVHRNPQHRAALARIAGRAASEVVLGAPLESEFADRASPAVIVLGLDSDYELELEFAHRIHQRAAGCHFILIAVSADIAEAQRLFELVDPEILPSLPTERVLRASLGAALARRRAESLARRRSRQRVSERFSTWLGGVEIPGLLRALDPSLRALPLLVRGRPGSGRALLARYVELFRGGEIESAAAERASTLRIHSSEIAGIPDLLERLANRREASTQRLTTVWIDEADALSASAQNALADWVTHGTSPTAMGLATPRWIATASATQWLDALEPALAQAFMPLVIEIPALEENPDALSVFVAETARAWSRSVGGPERSLSVASIAELGRRPWPGDRAELEAVLRAALASSSRNPVEPDDLGLDMTEDAPRSADSVDSDEAREELPVVLGVLEASEVEPLDLEPKFPIEAPIEERVEQATTTPTAPTPPTPPTPPPTPPTLTSAAWPTEEAAAAEDLAWPEDLRLDEDPGPVARPAESAQAAPLIDESVRLSEAAFDLASGDAPIEAGADQAWRNLARSLSHEIRNPLVSIKTFTELLPEHYEDETFRARFADFVGRDVAHINDVVTRMLDVSKHDARALEAIDVSAMIEGLLDERRERIAQSRLLVLRELERDAPLAWAEPASLEIALAGLIDRALDSLPERGDLFVATRHVERGQDGEPRLRILLRHPNPEMQSAGSRELGELRPESNILEYVLAETIARASGGSLTLDSSDAQESLILLELRTPN